MNIYGIVFSFFGLFGYALSSVTSLSISLPVLIIAILGTLWQKNHAGLLFSLNGLGILILAHWTPLKSFWPAPVFLCMALTGMALMIFRGFSWVSKMPFQKDELPITLLLGIGCALTVAAWMQLEQIRPEQIIFKIPLSFSTFEIILMLFMFAIFNGYAEELLFRGLAMDSLGRNFIFTNAAQAIAFGIYHYKGFPFGYWGVGLSCFFALLMGLMRQRTGNLFHPFIAHAITNFVMGLILFKYTRF